MAQNLSDKLATTFAGVKMRSPIGVGPMNIPRGERSYLTPEIHSEVLLKHVEAGGGFLYMPGFDYISEELVRELRPKARPRESARRPSGARFMEVKTPGYGVEGLLHFGMTSVIAGEANTLSFDLVRKTLELVKKGLPEGVPLIAAHTPLGDYPESAIATAKKAEELGIDVLEINFGCGFITAIEGAVDYYLERSFPLVMGGPMVCEHFDLVEKIVREVVKKVHIPVGVKVTSEIGFPRIVELARNLKDAGARYIEIHNFAPAIAPPDIYNRGNTSWPYLGGNPFVVTHGGLLRMSCYKNVAGVAKFAPGIEIAASGGLLSPEHVVEVMMLGAGIAEFVTGILTQGRGLLRRSIEFLERFMEEQGYNSVAEFTGIGVKHIEPVEKVEFSPGRVVAEVDPAKCKGSGICTDNTCIAMVRENGKPRVIPEACDGCGLCVYGCPNGAIKLRFLD